jgi:hypothetical protein
LKLYLKLLLLLLLLLRLAHTVRFPQLHQRCVR